MRNAMIAGCTSEMGAGDFAGSATRQPDPTQLQVEAPAIEQGPETAGVLWDIPP